MLSNLRRVSQRLVTPAFVTTPNRGIKLHEYQAGNLLASYNVAIPLGHVASTADEALKIAKTMPMGCVVKS